MRILEIIDKIKEKTFYDDLFKKSRDLELEYEAHFEIPFPQRIVGWWDPMNITLYPEELEKGVAEKEKEIRHAIRNNKPIEEIPEDLWRTTIF